MPGKVLEEYLQNLEKVKGWKIGRYDIRSNSFLWGCPTPPSEDQSPCCMLECSWAYHHQREETSSWREGMSLRGARMAFWHRLKSTNGISSRNQNTKSKDCWDNSPLFSLLFQQPPTNFTCHTSAVAPFSTTTLPLLEWKLVWKSILVPTY